MGKELDEGSSSELRAEESVRCDSSVLRLLQQERTLLRMLLLRPTEPTDDERSPFADQLLAQPPVTWGED